MNKKQMFTSIVFVLALWMPFIQMQTGIFQEGNLNENRSLIKRPEIQKTSLQDIRSLISDYEKYFNDNFGFRNILVDIDNRANVQLFHVSPIHRFIIGKNGWVFYRSESVGDGNTINDYQGLIPFPDDKLEKIRLNLELISKHLKDMNIFPLIVIVPNKETIYSEYMPYSIRKINNNQTRLDQLTEYMRRHSDAHFINLKEDLLTAKSKFPVYYNGGTHWNQYGAFFCYQRILGYLSQYFPEIKALSIDDFKVATELNSPKDSRFDFVRDYNFIFTPVKKMSIESIPYAGWNSTAKEIPDSRLPRLVMFSDSFVEALIPFLSEHFSRSLYLSGTNPDFQLIREERPDVVIIELVERNIALLGEPEIRAGDSRYHLAAEYYKSGEYKAAKKCFEQLIIEKDYHNPIQRYYLGVIYDKLKEYDKAISMLTETISRFPYFLDAYNSLGISYKHAGNYAKAIQTYKDLLRINENSEAGHFGIGVAYYEMGEYSSAIDEFKRAIEINPKNFDGYYNIASIYAERKDIQSSIDWLKKAAIAGFRDFESVRSDKVFAPIIRDERFKRMEKI